MDDILLKTVKNDIHRHKLFAKGEGLVLGVSGGADSVCLLSVLKELQREYALRLTAVHVNHGLRGEESDRDQCFVEELCRLWEVTLKVFQADIAELSRKHGTTLEEAGREVRYSFFNQVLEETKANSIAVAHNREDQAETVMLNLLRGTGLDGLCGMRFVQGKVIRPLLNVSRAQIVQYLSDRSISFRTDSSNLSNDYTRNKVRNVLFPAIQDLFGIHPVNPILKLSKLLQEDRDYLDEAAEKAFLSALITDSNDVELSIEKLKTFPPALSKRIIRRGWEKIKGSRKNLEQVHVEQIMNLCNNGHTGKKIQLPEGVAARVSYDRLILSKQREKVQNPFSYKVEREGKTLVQEVKGLLSAEILPGPEAFERYGPPDKIKENSLLQLFDLDRLEGEITVRSRKDGDRIRPHGLGGEKKLKDFFIDQKVPQETRSRIPLLTRDNRVVWIVGMRTSDDFRARNDTRNVWVLSWSDYKMEEKKHDKDEGFNQQRGTGSKDEGACRTNFKGL